MKHNKWQYIVIIIIVLGIYFLNPSIHENTNYIFKLLKEFKLDELKQYIISFGAIGPIVSILILTLQCVLAPLPLSLVVFANSYIYGWGVGSIISCIGTLIGSSISFFISRIYGRPIAEKFVSSKILDMCDNFFIVYGKKIVFASRLLPFISFDGFSYAAGLTKISFKYFFWATLIGQIPVIVTLSLLGVNVGNSDKFIRGIILCSILTVLAMIISYVIYRRKYNGASATSILKKKYQSYKNEVNEVFKR